MPKPVVLTNTILVTGGAGFIGSNFICDWLREMQTPVVNLDLLTEAGNLANLHSVGNDSRYCLVRGDICDSALVARVLREYHPRAIIHLAAENCVERSIANPEAVVRANIHGTFTLLEEARRFWNSLAEPSQRIFRFLHVSTDEVYGSLALRDPAFTETTAYAPNSPYAASKAASDHLVHACHHTWGLPTLITHGSDNYGPFQFPEKLIPHMILNALGGKRLSIYGDGGNSRDWLYVQDHCAALRAVLDRGVPGRTYNMGGSSERTGLQVANSICRILDEIYPHPLHGSHSRLLTHVNDRPGHDRRHAINSTRITQELRWRPSHTFEAGLRKTVKWYLDNPAWIESIRTGGYRSWMEEAYAERVAI